MKKFLTLIMALVIMTSILTGCSSKNPTTETFDWGGITIDIPTNYEVGSYSNKFESINQGVSFTTNENWNFMTIACMPGEWIPDDDGALGGGTVLETLEEEKYTMDGHEVRYGNYKFRDTNNIVLLNHIFSLYLDDRWIVVQTYTDNKNVNKAFKSVIDSIKISDNQYEFPGFDGSKSNVSVNTTEQTQNMKEIIALNNLRPIPTSEPTENPLQYEYYEFCRIIILI